MKNYSFNRSRRNVRFKRNRRAAATVETAMLIPLLILVSLGATDVAQYINLAQSITNAARHGARFAAKDSTLTVGQVEDEVGRVFADRSRVTFLTKQNAFW